MRNIIIIISILILIIGGAIFTQKYLNASSKRLSEDLKGLKQEMENNEGTGLMSDELEQKTEKIYDNWEKTSKIWAILIAHQELDLVETKLVNIKSAIKAQDFKDAMKEINHAIFLVGSITEKEKVKMKNLF